MKTIRSSILTILIFLATNAYVIGSGTDEVAHNPYNTSILDTKILGSSLSQFLLLVSLILFIFSFILFYLSRRNKTI